MTPRIDPNHQFIVPVELQEQWLFEYYGEAETEIAPTEGLTFIATRAAQWGADKELEACLQKMKEIVSFFKGEDCIDNWDHLFELVRDYRRPTRFQQAIDALLCEQDNFRSSENFEMIMSVLQDPEDD